MQQHHHCASVWVICLLVLSLSWKDGRQQCRGQAVMTQLQPLCHRWSHHSTLADTNKTQMQVIATSQPAALLQPGWDDCIAAVVPLLESSFYAIQHEAITKNIWTRCMAKPNVSPLGYATSHLHPTNQFCGENHRNMEWTKKPDCFWELTTLQQLAAGKHALCQRFPNI